MPCVRFARCRGGGVRVRHQERPHHGGQLRVHVGRRLVRHVQVVQADARRRVHLFVVAGTRTAGACRGCNASVVAAHAHDTRGESPRSDARSWA
eukprot:2512748-Prymnesium_polylepis.1